MKAVFVLFDTLRKNSLTPYGAEKSITPNFDRLAAHTVAYDRHYIGSFPCMPARRELHTGRYNFLHRGWGPIEPYDDSMPQMLKENGVYTHLVSDHYHYWGDGGETYHPRYSSWENVRGHELDAWKADLHPDPAAPDGPEFLDRFGFNRPKRYRLNMKQLATPELSTVHRVFDLGLEFLDTNYSCDNWFLQLENFCPHEPFYSYEKYRSKFGKKLTDKDTTWSQLGHIVTDADRAQDINNDYLAALMMCDENLGRLLDFMDEKDMWKDTMLIVTTDHGTLLGEHEEWGKNMSPFYQETANTPLFIWDPRTGEKGFHSDAFNQMIDVAPTILEFFGKPIPKDMQGRPITTTTHPDRQAGLFGTHGGYTCVTDGRYVYMRAAIPGNTVPTYNYGLMPTALFTRFSTQVLAQAELVGPFDFTKDCKLLKTPGQNTDFGMKQGTMLFDVEADPEQNHPLNDPELEQRMIDLMCRLMAETDAPEDQYLRLGLTKPE